MTDEVSPEARRPQWYLHLLKSTLLTERPRLKGELPAGTRIPLLDGQVVTIGRSGDADLYIRPPYGGPCDCRIRLLDGVVQIYNSYTRGGVCINNQQIETEVWHTLEENSRIRIADKLLTVHRCRPD